MVRKGGRNKKKNVGGRKIKGRGDYKSFNLRGMAKSLDKVLSSIPKGAFARKGAQMGAKYGPLGALAGKGLGAGLAAVTGYGNYSVRANSLSKMSTSVDMIPQFVKNDHSIRVTHREFIKDLVVPNDPSTFSLESFLINPANSTLFPWLATMARQYSQYKIHGMVFAYKTMSSDITAGGALGTVIMATNYNSIDRAFSTKIEMENSEFAVSTKPSMSLIHAIECDPKYSGLDVLYVRDPSYETSDTNDRRFYDYGRFQLATTGLPGTTGATMGEIWVSYDIEFMKPVLGGNGLPGYIPGKAMVSKPDATFGVSTNARICAVAWTGNSITPAPSTAYSVLPAAATPLGDTGIVGADKAVEVDFTANRIYLRRNGDYYITFTGEGPTTVNNPVLASDADQPILLTTLNAGTAASSYSVLGGSRVPRSCAATASSTGLQYTIQFTFTVTGIVAPTDFVRITPGSFTTAPSSLISSLRRDLIIEWLAFGINNQDPSFTPVIT